MKKALLAIGLVALFIAAGALLYGRVFTPDATRRTWLVSTLTGSVQVSVGGAEWQDATIKQPLSDGDRIRTQADGEVTLVHDTSHVTVRASTEMEVSQLNGDGGKFQLAEGQVFVEARGDRVSMRTRSGASMDAKDAGVGMTVLPNGWTQVIVKRGAVDFTALDHTKHVGEGEESHASVGGTPSEPIPQVLLLNVRFPDADTFNKRIARVEGKADPGSRVKVGDAAVQVAADGTWSADVPLDEGINQIEVAATDSVGHSRTETSQPIRVDTTAPGLDGASIGSHAVGPGASGTSP